MKSFIITLNFMKRAVMFLFVRQQTLSKNVYTVTALNETDFEPFLLVKKKRRWHIMSDVPEEMKVMERKLGVMVDAFQEGQRIY